MEHDGGTGAVLTGAATIRHVAVTGSTNTDLLAGAGDGTPEGEWLRADRQTAGRGRLGRSWDSQAGNLHASTLVRLRADDPSAPTLALVAAVALDEAASVFVPGRLSLKWPNDLLADGRKVAGILLERSGNAVVIGFGVNLAHAPEVPDRPTTSLADLGHVVAPADMLAVLAEAFARWLVRWRASGLAPVRDRWLVRAHPVGTALSVRLPDGARVDGLFGGLDDAGALVLHLAGGDRRVIHAGDVFLI